MRLLRGVLARLSVIENQWVKRDKLRAAILTMTIVLSVGMVLPIRTVKGLVVDTGIFTSHQNDLSIDANRVATLNTTIAGSSVTVYDIISGGSVSFPAPAFSTLLTPIIHGNKIVEGAATSIIAPVTLYYCVLPDTLPLTPCGLWTAFGLALPSLPQLSLNGGLPVFRGDIVAWPTGFGFSYYRFSTGVTTAVATPAYQATALSTNGEIIAIIGTPMGASSGTLLYYDATNPAAGVITTTVGSLKGLPTLSQHIIAYAEASSGLQRIGYYNILSNANTAPGSGPLGSLGGNVGSFPQIWSNRIAFMVNETALGFDCGNTVGIKSNEFCMRYWNINGPSYVVPFLDPPTAPPLFGSEGVAIYGSYIAMISPNSHLKIARIPVQGDVDLNGKVDIIDMATAAICFGKNLLTSDTAPCSETSSVATP